jgi:phage-related protein
MPRDTETNERYSVCIGIDTYAPETGLKPLSCAENDARAMDKVLGELGFAPENRVLLLGEEATLDAVNDALGEMIFNCSKENDLVVVYFAGHSTPVTLEDRSGVRASEVFLATTDFRRQRLMTDRYFRQERALGMERVRRVFFEGSGSRKRLFIFDSCYSGDFYGSAYRDDTNQVLGYIREKMNSETEGRIFIASCLPYQQAQESITYGHGQFTYYLLQALKGDPDAVRNDGTLTAGSLFDYLNDKLQNQKPVKGGVEFGSFVFTRYPHLARTDVFSPGGEDRAARETQLQEKWIDQSDTVQDLLERFVGREEELAALEERIAGQRERGGYVPIVGDAGQGKSSIIAKLIEKQGRDDTAYHFVPSRANIGSEYQILLLRSLMARLLLKYDLPARYIAGESYPILCDYFVRLLKEISEQQAQETVYIDGLDQLSVDKATGPDLSFLPDPLPPGIVIVVGTRPNEALRQLQRLASAREPYSLPGLSRGDFDLLLRRHDVTTLTSALKNLLVEKLGHSPLYLGLVAEELVKQPELQSEAAIARIASNPENIFGLTFSRLQQVSGWLEIIRPLVGTLLVAQEPLSSSQIAHILHKEEVRVRAGVISLGGLLAHSGQQKYTLFHSKLRDYLGPQSVEPDSDIQFSPGEVEELHGNLACWCEQESPEQIWQPLPAPTSSDDYQEYARKHYIFHLYHAGNYQRLFDVLNAGTYEREKLRFDRSTRSSAADLLLGCEAAARLARTPDEGRNLLNALWRYTLLRTSLATRADAYPTEAFEALLAMGREHEASGLIELLTQPERKLAALIHYTRYLFAQGRENDSLQLYSRTYEIATTITRSETKTETLKELTSVLIQFGHLAEAEEVARELQKSSRIAEALAEVSEAYGEQHEWQQAEKVARALDGNDVQLIRALSSLAARRYIAKETDEADRLWQEVSTRIATLPGGEPRDKALSYLATSFLQAREWDKADETARSLASKPEKIRALGILALALAQAGLREQADTAQDTMRETVDEINVENEHDQAQVIYAITLAEADFLTNAETIATSGITHPANKVAVYRSIASGYIKRGSWEQSKRMIDLIVQQYRYSDVDMSELDTFLINLTAQLAQAQRWDLAKETAYAIPRREARCKALIAIVIELARAGIRDTAESTWDEAKALFLAQTSDIQVSVAGVLIAALVEAGQVEKAREIITTPPPLDEQAKGSLREKLALALAKLGRIAEAREIENEITNGPARWNVVQNIAIAQLEAKLTEQAIETVSSIPNEERRSYALSELVAKSCQMQQWELAQKIASQIPSGPVQGEALNHIIVGLVKGEQLQRAQNLIRTIENEYRKANAWYSLVATYAQIGGPRDRSEKLASNIKNNDRIKRKAVCAIYIALKQSGLAASVARAIPESSEKAEALRDVAVAYARDHSWEDALKIVGEINDERIRDEAWGAIAREYAGAGQWMPALSIFGKMQNRDQRKEVLQACGAFLARSTNINWSERIAQSELTARHLDQSAEKASLLVSMADALAREDRDLELIHLIQRSWLQIGTKDDCQHLFAIVYGVLLHNPEICNDFYRAFEWAGTFVE